MLLDLPCQPRLLCQRSHPWQVRLFKLLHLQGIGEVELEALVIAQTVPQLLQEKRHLKVANRIGGHHEFESVVVFQDMLADETLPSATAILVLEFPDCFLAGTGNKGHGTCRRVEQGDPLRCQSVASVKLRL